jgi:hypothetical protein
MFRHASVAVVACVCAMGVMACSGDDASSTSTESELTDAELLTAADFGSDLEAADASLGFIDRPIVTDGCAPIDQAQLEALARRRAVYFESGSLWEVGEVVYADSPDAVAEAYDSIVEGLLTCIDDPATDVALELEYTAYAKRIELPDFGGDAFAVVSGLYSVPAGDDHYLDEDFVGSVYDEGIVEPFCRHLVGIVRHGNRLVVVYSVGRTEIKNLINSGQFVEMLELAVNRLSA